MILIIPDSTELDHNHHTTCTCEPIYCHCTWDTIQLTWYKIVGAKEYNGYLLEEPWTQ